MFCSIPPSPSLERCQQDTFPPLSQPDTATKPSPAENHYELRARYPETLKTCRFQPNMNTVSYTTTFIDQCGCQPLKLSDYTQRPAFFGPSYSLQNRICVRTALILTLPSECPGSALHRLSPTIAMKVSLVFFQCTNLKVASYLSGKFYPKVSINSKPPGLSVPERDLLTKV